MKIISLKRHQHNATDTKFDNAFINEESIKLALEIINSAAKVILSNEKTAGRNDFAVLMVQGLGFYVSVILGDEEAAENNKSDLEKYTSIAKWKLEKTIATKLSTGEIIRDQPELLKEGDYPYAGSAIDLSSNTVAAVSGAKGLSDESLAKFMLIIINLIASLNRDEFMAKDANKNDGKIFSN